MLTPLERQTILASLRNGLGLTHVCRGLHKHPKEVSDDIKGDPEFHLDCNKQSIAGYQSIVIELNQANSRKAWEKWRTHRIYIDAFISQVNLWESFCSKENFSFSNFTLCFKQCKTIPETATAMGFTETELFEQIYKDSKLVHWMIQNNLPI